MGHEDVLTDEACQEVQDEVGVGVGLEFTALAASFDDRAGALALKVLVAGGEVLLELLHRPVWNSSRPDVGRLSRARVGADGEQRGAPSGAELRSPALSCTEWRRRLAGYLGSRWSAACGPFVDTEEVTGSIPVSPTSSEAISHRWIWPLLAPG